MNVIQLLANSKGWLIYLPETGWAPLPLTVNCPEAEAVEFVKALPIAKGARAISVRHRES